MQTGKIFGPEKNSRSCGESIPDFLVIEILASALLHLSTAPRPLCTSMQMLFDARIRQ